MENLKAKGPRGAGGPRLGQHWYILYLLMYLRHYEGSIYYFVYVYTEIALRGT